MKKYYAQNGSKISISIVEIVRESKNDVWVAEKFVRTEHGARCKKIAAYSGFFDTFKEAKDFLYTRANVDRMKTFDELHRLTNVIDKIITLKEPS